MTNIIIAALIVFVLSLCFCVLLRRGSCCAVYTKEELLETLRALPADAHIYIAIEIPKSDRIDNYGKDNS